MPPKLDESGLPVRRHRLADLHVYDVTEDELDQIEQQASEVGLDFQFASNSFVVFVSFLITLTTIGIESERLFVGYLTVALVAGAFAVYFAIRWWRGRKQGIRIIQRIRQRAVGPLGDEEKQFRATDLEQIPGEPPSELKGSA